MKAADRKMQALLTYLEIKTVKPTKEAKALMGRSKKRWEQWEEANNHVRLLFNGWAGVPEEERQLVADAVAELALEEFIATGTSGGLQ